MNPDPTDPADPPPDPALVRTLRDSRGLLDAPPAVQQQAMALFAARRAAPPGPAQALADGLARLARLVFDSLAPTSAPYALGLRGDAPAGSRQWLFAAGEHEVDLRLDHSGLPGEQPWRLAGQVLGPAGARGLRLLEDAPEAPRRFEAPLGDDGGFSFDHLPAGRWRLWIDFDAGQPPIALPPLAWPAPPTA